jgi:hypothetical protein
MNTQLYAGNENILHCPDRIPVPYSVADPGCLSRILIFTHPGSRIPDPKTATKERGEKKCFQRIIELFTQKFVTKL